MRAPDVIGVLAALLVSIAVAVWALSGILAGHVVAPTPALPTAPTVATPTPEPTPTLAPTSTPTPTLAPSPTTGDSPGASAEPTPAAALLVGAPLRPSLLPSAT